MKKYTWQTVDPLCKGKEYVDSEVAQGLYDALVKIDKNLEGRNFLENSSLRDTARAALAAADGEE